MESTAKRRLARFGAGALLAAVVTAVVRISLVGEGVAAEPYAVAVGTGVAMPVLLSAAYPLTSVDDRRTRATLAVAESAAGVAVGAVAVTVLLAVELPGVIPVGGAAAAAYLGGVAARALVLGRAAVDESIVDE
ncbi:hypothetical protein [Halolamina sp. C58]|uniref:hypothetical protein n=1 Tax=Halolamina sp. C58 TaxID=3421640 RepID=UPI003EBF9A2E